jgi:tetratricopeptide (TPR) repeat protein
VRQAGQQPGESRSDFASRVAQLEQAVEEMQKVVQENENRFTIRTESLAGDPLARARLALQLGLAGKALNDVLLRSHPDLYRVEGLRLLLELLLFTGRASEARDLLDRDEMRRNPSGLGYYDLAGSRRWSYRFLAYDWFDVLQTTATGNYDGAARALERMRNQLEREGNALTARLSPALALRVTSELGVSTEPSTVPLRMYANLEREQVSGWVVQSQFLPVERADLHTLEGMLLLERGQPEQAREHFRRSASLYRDAAETVPALPGKPLTLRYLERLGELQR